MKTTNHFFRSIRSYRLMFVTLAALTAYTPARGADPLPGHPLRGSVQVSVLLCRFADSSTPVRTVTTFQNMFFSDAVAGSVKNYWKDISKGTVILQGTVNGWYVEPRTFEQAKNRGGSTNQDCIDAAKAAGYTPPAGSVIVVIKSPAVSGPIGGRCAAGDVSGCKGWVLLGDQTDSGTPAHEIGHALDLMHSFSNDPYITGGSEYNDQWDLMSYAKTFGQPGLNGVQLDRLGLLPRNQILTIGSDGGTGGVYRLKPLYSSATGVKLIRIPFDAADPYRYFTVEYRRKSAWDASIPADIVLIHETRKHPDGRYYSYLLRKTTSEIVCSWKCTVNGICGNSCIRKASNGTGAPEQSVYSNGRYMVTVNLIDSVKQEAEVTISLPSTLITTAQTVFGPNTCKLGFFWREADAGDYVCVSQAVRDQTRSENLNAAGTRNPLGGPYGADTCLNGYVWREAFPNDRVCVLPASRTQAADDNKHATERIAKP